MFTSKSVSAFIGLITFSLILPFSAAHGAGYEPTAPVPVAPTAASPTPSATAPATPAAVPVKTVATELTRINSILYGNDFRSARTALLALDREFTNNADINNLLGFSSRKLMDYRASATYYTKALRINPNHLGALEYQGELFVTTKRVAAAKRNLQKLERLCGLDCTEYKDLKKAIGNR